MTKETPIPEWGYAYYTSLCGKIVHMHDFSAPNLSQVHSPSPEIRMDHLERPGRVSAFGFWHSFGIRHLGFVIPVRVCRQTHSFQGSPFPANFSRHWSCGPPLGNNHLQSGGGFVTCGA